MRVIQSKHVEMPRRVWSFKEDGQVDVMTAWVSATGPGSLEVAALTSNLILYEYGGQKAIDSIIEDISDDLYVFRPFVQRVDPPALIFLSGPFQRSGVDVFAECHLERRRDTAIFSSGNG